MFRGGRRRGHFPHPLPARHRPRSGGGNNGPGTGGGQRPNNNNPNNQRRRGRGGHHPHRHPNSRNRFSSFFARTSEAEDEVDRNRQAINIATTAASGRKKPADREDYITALDLEPANNWYFTEEQLRNTPSRRCGLDEDSETILRDKGCRVILTLAKELNRYPRLSQTACLYFHRIYMRKSFTEYNEYKLMAATCFWIAAKWDDRPVKSTHIVELFIKIINKDFQSGVDFESPLFMEYRRRILFYEIEAFKTLCFDCVPRAPFDMFIPVIAQLDVSTSLTDAAAAVLNDIYLSPTCLRFSAHVLFATAIVYGAKIIQVDIPAGKDGRTFRQVTGLASDEGRSLLKDALNAMTAFYRYHEKSDDDPDPGGPSMVVEPEMQDQGLESPPVVDDGRPVSISLSQASPLTEGTTREFSAPIEEDDNQRSEQDEDDQEADKRETGDDASEGGQPEQSDDEVHDDPHEDTAPSESEVSARPHKRARLDIPVEDVMDLG
ncbi:hypothetical protein DFJ77DRAFT_454243 [Powellomyces hirtus]|nr:hypothetical protein DFJ77DRAFT_454243 [Powellomyces hirtus]